MKLQYIAIATLAVGALSLSSCDDFLDKMPDSRVELKTTDQLRMLLVDGYCSSDIAPVLEIASDNIHDNNSADDESNERFPFASMEPWQDEAFTWQDIVSNIDTNSPSLAWEGYYHAIAVANAVLEKVPEFEAEGKGDEVAPYKGEALLIRAYNHFQLANIFCLPYRGPELSKTIPGIPYMTRPETEVKPNYDRGNLAEVFELIDKDLNEGLPLIDNSIYTQPKYHFNRAAAHAFAARFYLFKRDYAKCDSVASIALGDNPAMLMNDLWSQHFPGSSYYGQHNINVANPHNFLLTATYSLGFRHISNGRYTSSRDAAKSTYRGYGPTWTQSDRTGYVCHPCFADKIYRYDNTGVRLFFPKVTEIFEMRDKINRTGFAHIVRTDFTSEETLLCRAEARLFLGDIEGCIADLQIWDDARWICSIKPGCEQPKLTVARINAFYRDSNPGHGIVKKIRIDEVCPSDKYALTADKEPILQCIQHFRRIETLYDGLRWYDIRRLGLEITHKYSRYNEILTLKWDDPRKALQIPPDVLSAGFKPNDRLEIKPSEGGEMVADNRVTD